MIRVTVTLPRDSGALERVRDALTDRTDLHAGIVPLMLSLTQKWVLDESDRRHGTARQLGGSPTGELGRAVSLMVGNSDATAATLDMASPLLSRAFRDVTIVPGPGKKFLSLPKSGPAYGKSASELAAELGVEKLTFLRVGRIAILAHFEKGRKIGTTHYLLVPKVTQKQDRSLLPSDALYLRAATEAALDYLNTLN